MEGFRTSVVEEASPLHLHLEGFLRGGSGGGFRESSGGVLSRSCFLAFLQDKYQLRNEEILRETNTAPKKDFHEPPGSRGVLEGGCRESSGGVLSIVRTRLVEESGA